mmetsp:Transcript_13626/g.27158  ORF Transcript_13626/g.27158 Transcript_13626/m.27158 type:complete len:91 (-) Transcript_13626:99-371(-)
MHVRAREAGQPFSEGGECDIFGGCEGDVRDRSVGRERERIQEAATDLGGSMFWVHNLGGSMFWVQCRIFSNDKKRRRRRKFDSSKTIKEV